MENTDIKQRITKTLDNLNSEQLALVEKILKEITVYFKLNTSLDIALEETQKNDDPLAQLRNSDFIGCFADEPDLAEKSEAIAQAILSQKDIH